MSELAFRQATEADIPALIKLVTSAYRGEASQQGWTTEADLLDGQRIDADMLQADMLQADPAQPDSMILIAEKQSGLIACAHIAVEHGAGYFGMFSVSPEAQRGGIGKAVLAEAERIARDTFGCTRMRMTVIDAREELIAYYLRRSYVRTGVKKPFPYGDPRYGLPKRDDLQFEVLEKILERTP